MRIVSLAATLLLGSLLWTQAAAAGTITETVDFTATDFVPVGAGGTPPVDPVTGTFSLNFDPTLDYTNDSANISVSSLNITLDSGDPKFNYDSVTHVLEIFTGSIPSVVTGGTNSFYLAFVLNPSAPSPFFQYAQAGNNFSYIANTTSVTLAATPIPGSIIMLLTALAAFGVIAVVRQRKTERTPSLAAA